ncbi:MAG: hypothetical protein JKY54_03770, partial [Flavobacteriales bacterium]|nr:hypothetical protein [Flavobacteriales bacterium]
PYITTDFSESQIEMITPPLNSLSKVHGFLESNHILALRPLESVLLF